MKIGSVVVSLDVDIGRMSRFTSAARTVEMDSNRMRRGMGETTRTVGMLRNQMSQPMRMRMFSDSLRTISRTNNEMQRLQATFVGLSALTGTGLTAALGGTYLIQTADRARLLSNQLKTVTEDHVDLANIQERLYDVAQRTRSSLDGTTRIYARTARAAEFFALSQEKVLKITETIQKAFAIGGATQAEAFGSAIQLSQGIASDRFSGEEFRSVAENAPVLLQGMAKAMGKNIGQLREMAHAGELTGKVVTDLILAAATDIDKSFESMTVTVGQAFTRLDNAFVQYIGDVDESYGVTRRLAGALSSLAANFDEVAQYAGLAVAATATLFAGRKVGQAYSGAGGAVSRLIQDQTGEFQRAARVSTALKMQLANTNKEIAFQEGRVVDSAAKVARINALARQRNHLLSAQAAEVAKLRNLENQWAAAAIKRDRATAVARSISGQAATSSKADVFGAAQGDRLVVASVKAREEYLKSVDRLNDAKKVAAGIETKHASAITMSTAAIAKQRSAFEAAQEAMTRAPSAASLDKTRNEYGKIAEAEAKAAAVSQNYVAAQQRANALVDRRTKAVINAAIAERQSIEAVQRHADGLTNQVQKTQTLNGLKVRATALQETLNKTSDTLTKQMEDQARVVGNLNSQLKSITVTEKERVVLAQRHAAEVARLNSMTGTRTSLSGEITKSTAALEKARVGASTLGIAMAGAAVAGRTLLAAVGGVPGILFGAAVAGMIYYTQKTAKAEEATRSIVTQLENMGYLTREAADEMERFQNSVQEGRISKLQDEVNKYNEEIQKTVDKINDMDFLPDGGVDLSKLSKDMSTAEYDEAYVAAERLAQETNRQLQSMAAEIVRTGKVTAGLRRELEGLALENKPLAGKIAEVIELGEFLEAAGRAASDTSKEISKLDIDTPSWLREIMDNEAAIKAANDNVNEITKSLLKFREEMAKSIGDFGGAGKYEAQNAALQAFIEKTTEAAQAHKAIEDAQRQLALFSNVAMTEVIGDVDRTSEAYARVRDELQRLAGEVISGSIGENVVASRLAEIQAGLRGLGVGESIINSLTGSFAALVVQMMEATRALQQYQNQQMYTVRSASGGTANVTVTRHTGGGASVNGPSGSIDPDTGIWHRSGFAGGGYTGDGGKLEVAGPAHKGEFIFTKEETAAIGKENLAAMAKNAGYADGGFVGGTVGGVSSVMGSQTMTEIEINTAATVDQLKRIIGYLATIDSDLVALTSALRSSRSSSVSTSSGGSAGDVSTGGSSAGTPGKFASGKGWQFGAGSMKKTQKEIAEGLGMNYIPELRYFENGAVFGNQAWRATAGTGMGWYDPTNEGSSWSDESIRSSIGGSNFVAGSFATGGMMRPGGGGPKLGDKQLVQMFKNPGEAVYVLTGAQQSAFEDLGKAANSAGRAMQPSIVKQDVAITINVKDVSTPQSRQAAADAAAAEINRVTNRTNA